VHKNLQALLIYGLGRISKEELLGTSAAGFHRKDATHIAKVTASKH